MSIRPSNNKPRRFSKKTDSAGHARPAAEKKHFSTDKPRYRKSDSDDKFSAGHKDHFEEKEKPDNGFFESMIEVLTESGSDIAMPDFDSPDPLAVLDYDLELKFKLSAIRSFWNKHHLPGIVREIVPSPRPRRYRTTSKRKILLDHKEVIFSMGYGENAKGSNVLISPLECELHGKIYTHLYTFLSKPEYLPLASALNYCVLRGSYEKAALILNVFKLDSSVMRKVKLLAEHIRELEPKLISMFLFLDETKSPYYLESLHPGKAMNFKKIFGYDSLDITVAEQKMFYPPTAFSQINESMLEKFTSTALKMLSANKKKRFIDLYCGYGLFSMIAADHSESIVGMDLDRPAIQAAESNAAHIHPDKNIRFTSAAVTEDSIKKYLPDDFKDEVILLDPPRSGTAHGVIEAVAARGPERVLHIFCGTDRIPKELPVWRGTGYHVAGVKIFDMFPGSINLETMILLEKN